MSQLEEDMATLIGLVREIPTRAELAAVEARIQEQLSRFGTTVGGDVGRVLERLGSLEQRLGAVIEDQRQAGVFRRPARVR